MTEIKNSSNLEGWKLEKLKADLKSCFESGDTWWMIKERIIQIMVWVPRKIHGWFNK
jgi:hypothetical protein